MKVIIYLILGLGVTVLLGMTPATFAGFMVVLLWPFVVLWKLFVWTIILVLVGGAIAGAVFACLHVADKVKAFFRKARPASSSRPTKTSFLERQGMVHPRVFDADFLDMTASVPVGEKSGKGA